MIAALAVPTPGQIATAREAAGLSRTQAAELVYLGHYSRWSEYEHGRSPMPLGTWELFLLKTGQRKSSLCRRRATAHPRCTRSPRSYRGHATPRGRRLR